MKYKSSLRLFVAIAAITSALATHVEKRIQTFQINSTTTRNDQIENDGGTSLEQENAKAVNSNESTYFSVNYKETGLGDQNDNNENSPVVVESGETGAGDPNEPDENSPVAVESGETGAGDPNEPDESSPVAVESGEPGAGDPNEPGESSPVAVESGETGTGDPNDSGDNKPVAVKSEETGAGDSNEPGESGPVEGQSKETGTGDQNGTGENSPDQDGPEDPDTDGNENDTKEDPGTGDGNPPNLDYVVVTERGSVRGFLWPGSTEIVAYYDIPYGKFDSIFEEPSESNSWNEIREVRKHQKRCPQVVGDSIVGDTDCLTLSIFAPVTAANASVLFHIHESDFTSGSGDPAIYGPEYLVNKSIILVLPNYRLGALGFLCLRNDTIPGNAALKDLTLALRWINNNIHAFGGDPSNIAVSGDGTSAALAGYLAISYKSRQFFNKVITDSGSVLSHWAIDRNPSKTVMELLEHIRNQTLGEDLSENVLGNGFMEIILLSARHVNLRPCIEDDGFLNDSPWTILQNVSLNETYFMIGSANHAGLLEALRHNQESITHINNDFTELLPNDLVFASASERNEIAAALRQQYFSDNISLASTKEFSLFHTDASYLGPSIRVARALHEVGATVFLYEFSFVGTLNKELEALGEVERHGAVRGDITGYLFTQDSRLPAGEDEKQMVEFMTELWVSFIQTGTPASPGIVWHPLQDSAQESWLHINATPTPATGLHPDRMTLWTRVYRDHFVDRNSGTLSATANYLIVTCIYLISFAKIV